MSDYGDLYDLSRLDEPLEEAIRQDERERVAEAVREISVPEPVPPGWTSPGAGYAFSSVGRCRSFECERSIAWFRTPAGKTAPYDPDGVSHFATCPAAERFRRGRKEGR